jgi:hypothetical protein
MEKLIDKSPHPKYFKCEIDEMIPAFEKIAPTLGDKLIRVTQGDTVTVDECEIKFIYSYHEDLITNPMNDASLVFFITTPDKKVLFLGDLGPEGGDVLLEENYGNLKADIVQMAHHGQAGVDKNVYDAVNAKIRLWPITFWLWQDHKIWLVDKVRSWFGIEENNYTDGDILVCGYSEYPKDYTSISDWKKCVDKMKIIL